VNADARLSIVMARQHSLATRPQALEAGLTRRQIGCRLESGLWVAPQRGVYRPSSVRPYFHQHVMAACLAVDAHASGACAAAIYGLRGFEQESVEITVTGHRRQQLEDVTAQRENRLDPRDLTVRWHLPITTPAKTLLDIARRHPELTERAMNDALYRRLTRPEAIRSALTRACSVKAARLLGEILDHLAAPTESVLEDDFVALIRLTACRNPSANGPSPAGSSGLTSPGRRPW
jgi:hypothetical protein